MGQLRLYHCHPDDGFVADKGAEEGDAAPGRGWPPHAEAVTASDVAIVMIQPATLRAASRWTACSSPDRRRQDRAAPCAACRGPSTGVSAVTGRERPRLGNANLASEASGGVAHAPLVSV